MHFTPFARMRLERHRLSRAQVRQLVHESVIAIPVSGGKVVYEGVIGAQMVSVIVVPGAPPTVVALTARSL